MKKKLLALLTVLSLLTGILVLSLPSFAATPTVYILAVNDKFADLPILPEAVNGVIYIPYTAFDKESTHEDLGVYYGIRQDRDLGSILSLYSLSGTLTFAVNQGTCTDGDGNAMNFRAVMRNGAIYVPASAVCTFFGLQYFYFPTSDRGTLIRICSSAANLNDTVFTSAGSSGMLTRYNEILQSMEPNPTPTPSPSTPRPTPTPPPESSKSDVQVYLAVEASEAAGDLTDLFPDEVRVLFLFTPDSLVNQSALVRKAVAAGHSIGLRVSGTMEEVQAQLEEGNRLLSHIARIRTRIVSAPDALSVPLAAEGWLCWRVNVTGATAPALLANLAVRRWEGRLTLPGDRTIISRVVSRIRADGYTLRQPLETDL